MNKFKSLVLAAIGLLCSISVSAEDFEVDGIYYNITSDSEKTVEVTYKGMDSYAEVEYSGSVIIPETVTYSGITYNVTSIGYEAFYWCADLTSVVIPNRVTSIGINAFSCCKSLTSVEIPNSVTSIGDGAFVSCSNLTSVVIPNSVTSIEGEAFAYCSNLTSVEIGNSVTSIGGDAFVYTAWYDNQPDGVVYLENYLLGYKGTMPSNTSIEIKDGTLLIAGNAFVGCSNLTSVEIPNSVTGIGYGAFNYCSGLTSVVIPNSVTSIGDWAFSGCSGLTSVVIPNSVTSIASGLFQGCSSLTSVVIPNSVTSIEGAAFEDCNNLKSVTSLNPTPPATDYWDSPFTNHDATLYVPFGAKTAYSEANNWKNFTNIEELVYELTDGEEYNEASDKTVNTLVYTRTLPNLHWNALYVPFELPYDVVAEHYEVAYINDVNGYDTDDNGEIDDLAMEIIKIKGGTLKANYPYLIKAKTEADKAMSITVEDATLYAAEENSVDCSSVYQNYVVKGTYTKKTAEELVGKLAISTSGAWQPLAVGTALNPFRLYLSIENRDNSPLKVETSAMSRMRIVEGGETTGIEDVVPSQQREDVIFDLSGRRVKQPVKGGVYIVNGKKRIL